MNVGELRKAIAEIDADVEVIILQEGGTLVKADEAYVESNEDTGNDEFIISH